MLEAFVDRFREGSAYRAVEAAHMELAEPSVATAFDRCVACGAECVVVIPYFLLPGKHWEQDIPRLAAAAAAAHPGVSCLVGAPIGLHPMMMDVIRSRLDQCLAHAAGEAPPCEACAGTDRCRMRNG
jgi:sirohydrochlorin ferrochelatase